MSEPNRHGHRVVLYTKEDCCLCHRARELLSRLEQEFDLEVEEVEITSDPALFERYRYMIPVVVVDGRHRLESKITEYYLRKLLTQQVGSGRCWPWRR